jgi:hypothetical protein
VYSTFPDDFARGSRPCVRRTGMGAEARQRAEERHGAMHGWHLFNGEDRTRSVFEAWRREDLVGRTHEQHACEDSDDFAEGDDDCARKRRISCDWRHCSHDNRTCWIDGPVQ